ncbi:MAG: hypothetical protein U0L49_09965 [Eubacterium sp.]|nr:hypothetical protein [Eubacterium sp.]
MKNHSFVKGILTLGIFAAALMVGGMAASEEVHAQSFSSQEIDAAIASKGAGEVAMYRLFYPYTGEHLYTKEVKERDVLMTRGWNYEGVGWFAPASSKTPVYRMFNKYSGDHHYTMLEKEKNKMVEDGWTYEGIGWYSDDAKTIPLYRQFNPNVKIGTHNYTTEKVENDHLAQNGWNEEGYAWFALEKGMVLTPGSKTSQQNSSSSQNTGTVKASSDGTVTTTPVAEGQLTAEKFVAAAQNVCDMARTQSWTYGNTSATPPASDGRITCDKLVSRAMYDLGYTDQPAGGASMHGGLPDLLKSAGFVESNSWSDVKYGSVVMIRHIGAAKWDHTFVMVKFDPNTFNYYGLDVGSNKLIQTKQPCYTYWTSTWDKSVVRVFNLPS